MKIGLTLLVKDEIDILQYHLNFHVPKFDIVCVTDNGSTDGTRELLRKWESDTFIVIDEPNQNYQQSQWVTRMVNHLKSMGCDWVVNSDADEFWRGDLRKVITATDKEGFNCLMVDSYSFVTSCFDDYSITNPVERILWRSDKYDKWPKAANTTKGFVKVADGNDAVFFNTRTISLNSKQCVIYHYTSRGFDHFQKKYIDGGKVIEANHRDGGTIRSMWSKPYALYKEKGMEAFKENWIKERLYTEEMLKYNKLVRDDSLAKEFSTGAYNG